MNKQRQTKLSRLFRHLKDVIHADDQPGVRRRNLLSTRDGDVQLEFELGDAKNVFASPKWLDGKALERSLAG